MNSYIKRQGSRLKVFSQYKGDLSIYWSSILTDKKVFQNIYNTLSLSKKMAPKAMKIHHIFCIQKGDIKIKMSFIQKKCTCK